jgi:hypothetical protein
MNKAIVKVGKNEVEVEIINQDENGYEVRGKSGKTFRVKKVLRTIPARKEEDQEPPAGQVEQPVGKDEQKPTDCPKKKMSLINAAIEVLKEVGEPMGTKELVEACIERGLWIPTGCKTPEQTLYGSFFREIKIAEHPRIVKASKGKFAIAE